MACKVIITAFFDQEEGSGQCAICYSPPLCCSDLLFFFFPGKFTPFGICFFKVIIAQVSSEKLKKNR